MKEVWYRVEATQYAAPLDEWDNPSPYPGPCDARIIEYPVVKTTPKGVWIDIGFSQQSWAMDHSLYERPTRFVLRDARKRFACPTKAEAFESFFARKARHIKILEAQIARARRLVAAAKRLQDKECPVQPALATGAIPWNGDALENL